MLRDNYITLYNIYRDKDGENESFNRTIMYVHLEEERGSEKNAMGGGTTVSSKDSLDLFIPFCVENEVKKKFVEPDEYKKLDDKSSFFTFSEEDIVLKGKITEEITSEKKFILSHPSAKRVKTYIPNNFGSYFMRHWEVHCD